MVTEVGLVLGGKSGVLAQWYQRHSLVMSLEGVREGVASTDLPDAEVAKIAARAVDGLLPVVEKESHEETRAVALGCLARWVRLLRSMPPKFLQFLKNGISSNTRSAATAAASTTCLLSDSAQIVTELDPLVPALLERVQLGFQKPSVFHLDAIYGAKATLEVMVSKAAGADKVEEKFPWEALSDPASFLFPSSILTPQAADNSSTGRTAGPLLPHVCTALCRVIALAAKHAAVACAEPEGPGLEAISSASCLALIRCAAHRDPEVRQAALDATLVVCEVIPRAKVTLLKACREVRKRGPCVRRTSCLCRT